MPDDKHKSLEQLAEDQGVEPASVETLQRLAGALPDLPSPRDEGTGMTDQEDRIKALAREAAATYIAPFHDTDERLHGHRVGVVPIFTELRKRQERELATLIIDAIRTALTEVGQENVNLKRIADTATECVCDCESQLAVAREALEEIEKFEDQAERGSSPYMPADPAGYVRSASETAREALAKMKEITDGRE